MARSWVNDLDRIRSVITKPLEDFQDLLDPATFEFFLQRRAAVKKATWFTKNMTQDACVHICSMDKIQSAKRDLKRKLDDEARQGTTFTQAEITAKIKAVIEPACTEWQMKVPKYTPLLDQVYGPFVDKVIEMYNYCEKEKKKAAERGEKNRLLVTLGYDRALYFTQVAGLSNDLRCHLLEAQCKPDIRKAYFHPATLNPLETKNWLHTWSMWEQVEGLAISLLHGLKEEYPARTPAETLSQAGDVDKLHNEVLLLFDDYRHSVKERFFRGIWQTAHGDKLVPELLRKRAKRFVYRFIVYLEKKKMNYFLTYPAFLRVWNDDKDELSMYPSEGEEPPREMEIWEMRNCPWYLETKSWSTTFDNEEKMHLQNLRKGGIPYDYLEDGKFPGTEFEEESAKEMEARLGDMIVSVDKSRKSKTKQKSKPAASEATQNTQADKPNPPKSEFRSSLYY